MLHKLFFLKKKVFSSVTECESAKHRERTLKKGAIREKYEAQSMEVAKASLSPQNLTEEAGLVQATCPPPFKHHIYIEMLVL